MKDPLIENTIARNARQERLPTMPKLPNIAGSEKLLAINIHIGHIPSVSSFPLCFKVLGFQSWQSLALLAFLAICCSSVFLRVLCG
jgi:hypothetical protein